MIVWYTWPRGHSPNQLRRFFSPVTHCLYERGGLGLHWSGVEVSVDYKAMYLVCVLDFQRWRVNFWLACAEWGGSHWNSALVPF